MMLAQSEPVLAFVRDLSRGAPNLEQAIARYKKKRGIGRHNSLSKLGAELLEDILYVKLQEMCDGVRAKLDPIPNEASTAEYKFVYRRGTVEVNRLDSRTSRIYTEYDAVVLIDQIPVLFEVKSTCCVSCAMYDDRIEHVLVPLRQYYGTNCAYVVVALTDKVFASTDGPQGDSKLSCEFRKKGGLSVPFYNTAEKYLQEVIQIAQKHDLLR